MTDPRAANCRQFSIDNAGLVTGVELDYRELPGGQFRLVKVELIDERAAQGNTVANCIVLDKDGNQAAAPVYLAWPWPNRTDWALPGNPHGQHMITNGYAPPDSGPLMVYVGDAAGNPIGDVIGGLGLPHNRHVSYMTVWRERAAEPDPDPEPEPAPALDVAVARIANALERLASHLGA